MMIIALCAGIALLPLVYVLWWYAATQSHAACELSLKPHGYRCSRCLHLSRFEWSLTRWHYEHNSKADELDEVDPDRELKEPERTLRRVQEWNQMFGFVPPPRPAPHMFIQAAILALTFVTNILAIEFTIQWNNPYAMNSSGRWLGLFLGLATLASASLGSSAGSYS